MATLGVKSTPLLRNIFAYGFQKNLLGFEGGGGTPCKFNIPNIEPLNNQRNLLRAQNCLCSKFQLHFIKPDSTDHSDSDAGRS